MPVHTFILNCPTVLLSYPSPIPSHKLLIPKGIIKPNHRHHVHTPSKDNSDYYIKLKSDSPKLSPLTFHLSPFTSHLL